MMTSKNMELPDNVVQKYLKALIGQFYKILPIKESGEPSLGKYMDSLQREMIGCQSLIVALDNDELYLSLLAVLQYLIENDCDTNTVKCEVFKAINICKKLQKKYGAEEV
ncbi:MAG: hypothetical protein IJD91_07805 [Clostridia bacterium]|nr:hypothetical protein [Clostridia bacterium]